MSGRREIKVKAVTERIRISLLNRNLAKKLVSRYTKAHHAYRF